MLLTVGETLLDRVLEEERMAAKEVSCETREHVSRERALPGEIQRKP